MPPFSSNQYKHLRLLAKILLSAALLAYSFSLVNIAELSETLINSNVTMLLLSFAFAFTGSIIIKSIFSWRVLNGAFSIKFITVVKCNLILRFYSIFLPRSAVTAIRWFKFKKLSDGKSSLVTLTLETLITLLALSVGGTLFAIIEIDSSRKFLFFGIASSTLLSFTLATLFFVPSNFIDKLKSHRLNRLLVFDKLSKTILKWFDAIRSLNSLNSRNILILFISSLGNYFFFIISSHFISLSMDLNLSFAAISWIRSFVLILAHAPFTVAGLGIREVGLITLFSLYGISPTEALCYAALSLLIQIAIAAFGAVADTDERLRFSND